MKSIITVLNSSYSEEQEIMSMKLLVSLNSNEQVIYKTNKIPIYILEHTDDMVHVIKYKIGDVVIENFDNPPLNFKVHSKFVNLIRDNIEYLDIEPDLLYSINNENDVLLIEILGFEISIDRTSGEILNNELSIMLEHDKSDTFFVRDNNYVELTLNKDNELLSVSNNRTMLDPGYVINPPYLKHIPISVLEVINSKLCNLEPFIYSVENCCFTLDDHVLNIYKNILQNHENIDVIKYITDHEIALVNNIRQYNILMRYVGDDGSSSMFAICGGVKINPMKK